MEFSKRRRTDCRKNCSRIPLRSEMITDHFLLENRSSRFTLQQGLKARHKFDHLPNNYTRSDLPDSLVYTDKCGMRVIFGKQIAVIIFSLRKLAAAIFSQPGSLQSDEEVHQDINCHLLCSCGAGNFITVQQVTAEVA